VIDGRELNIVQIRSHSGHKKVLSWIFFSGLPSLFPAFLGFAGIAKIKNTKKPEQKNHEGR
jgi:hypothetical protein